MSGILEKISDAAKARFAEIPFPHRKDEYWRFADLSAWSADALFPHFSRGVPESREDSKIAEISANAQKNGLAVFDGQLLSADVPAGVSVLSKVRHDCGVARAKRLGFCGGRRRVGGA